MDSALAYQEKNPEDEKDAEKEDERDEHYGAKRLTKILRNINYYYKNDR